MGAKDKNFYFNLMCEYGYEDIATQIQELYLNGNELEGPLPEEFGNLNTKAKYLFLDRETTPIYFQVKTTVVLR